MRTAVLQRRCGGQAGQAGCSCIVALRRQGSCHMSRSVHHFLVACNYQCRRLQAAGCPSCHTCPVTLPGVVLRRTAGGDKHACVRTDRFALKAPSLRAVPPNQVDEHVYAML